MNEEEATRPEWPIWVLAVPATVAIWSGWVGLGEMTGFGVVKLLPGIWDAAQLNTAITLPVGVEAYAAYAMSVWLAGGHEQRTRTFAGRSALGSLILGMVGQVAYHLMAAAGVTRAPWLITTVVSCLPVVVLGMGGLLAHLVRLDRRAHDADVRARTEAERLAALDAEREAHEQAAQLAHEAAQVERTRLAEDDAHRRTLEAAQEAHRQRLEEQELAARLEAQKAAQVAFVEPSRAPRTSRPTRRTAGARKSGAQGDDLQRRRKAEDEFKASVRAGTPLDPAALARILCGVDEPDSAQRAKARARASEWRRAVEAETRTEVAQ